MKFIKTADDWYIDQRKIESFSIAEKNNPKGFAVVCFINEFRFCLKECKRKIDAQAWLDDFVAKLNEEDDKKRRAILAQMKKDFLEEHCEA